MAKHFQVDTGGTLTTSLVSYWKFAGDSTDFWGSNNGTDHSMTYGSSFGTGENAIFSGSGYIGITQITGANLSFWGWFYPTSTTQVQQLLFYNVAAEPPIQVNWNETASRFQIDKRDGGGTWHSAISGSNLSLNTWYFVVGTYASGTLKIYVNNGTPVTTTFTF
jgi:hypothetical protein